MTDAGPDLGAQVWRVAGELGLTPARSGALSGHTVAIKDVFAVRRQRIGAGSAAWLERSRVQERTAPAVQMLLDAGARAAGLAHTDQFAYSIAGLNPDYPIPPNVAVPGAVPGGSSSGPAAAVALGLARIGLGTDTAGSIRVPASYQGLWGLRTTFGAISLEGVLPLAPSYDTVGWLTKDGGTMLAVARVALAATPHETGRRAGPRGGPVTAAASPSEEEAPAGDSWPDFVTWRALAEPEDPEALGLGAAGFGAAGGAISAPGASHTRSSTPRRVLVAPALTRAASSHVVLAFEAAVGALVEVGAIARPSAVELPGVREMFDAFRITQSAQAWRSHGAWVSANGEALAPDIAERFAFAASVTPAQEAEALARVAELAARIEQALGDAILLIPAAAGAAPRLDATASELQDLREATLGLSAVAGFTGRPALAVPWAVTPAGPVGVCLVGPRGSDIELIEAALEWEMRLG